MLKKTETPSVTQSANNSQALCIVGAFTFGLGVGAVAAKALAEIALALILAGCVTHLTGMILNTRRQNEPTHSFTRWERIFYWSSWVGLGLLLLVATWQFLSSG